MRHWGTDLPRNCRKYYPTCLRVVLGRDKEAEIYPPSMISWDLLLKALTLYIFTTSLQQSYHCYHSYSHLEQLAAHPWLLLSSMSVYSSVLVWLRGTTDYSGYVVNKIRTLFLSSEQLKAFHKPTSLVLRMPPAAGVVGRMVPSTPKGKTFRFWGNIWFL